MVVQLHQNLPFSDDVAGWLLMVPFPSGLGSVESSSVKELGYLESGTMRQPRQSRS